MLGLFLKDTIAAATRTKLQYRRPIKTTLYLCPGMGSRYTTSVPSYASGKSSAPYDQIILFGDSLTQNSFDPEIDYACGSALAHAYRRILDVTNRGFSGYNTEHARAVFPQVMPNKNQARVRLLIVWFGANDSCHPSAPSGHHVPVHIYRNNLAAIVTNPLAQAQDARVLLVTPPPIDERQRFQFDKLNGCTDWCPRRTALNTQLYAQACKETGAQLGIPVADVWGTFMRAAGWQPGQPLVGRADVPQSITFQSMFSDGLHLTGLGYRLVFDQVLDCIRKMWPELDPDKMAFVFPSWEAASKYSEAL